LSVPDEAPDQAVADQAVGDQTVGVLITFRESPFSVKALLFGVLVNKLGAFVQVFLVLFMTSRGFDAVHAGLALGAYGAGSVLGVLLGGSFSDRIGARRTIMFGMVGTALMLVCVLYFQVYPALLASVVVVGLISQVYRPAAAALLAEYTPRDRQVMVFAMYRLALNLGTTAAPLIGVALASVSYNLLFWGEAAAALGYAAVAMFALPRRTVSVGVSPSAGGGGSYLAVLRDRRFVAYLVAMLINAAVYVQYLSTLPLAMKAAGLQTLWYGVVVAINGAIVICFELLMTKVVQHWRMRLVLAIGFTLLGGGVACYALPGGLAVFVIGTLLWSLAEIIEGPTMFAYPAKAGPEQLRGRYLGAAHAMFGVGSALGPVVGVALWVQLGPITWVICGAASVAALVPAWYGIRART
jgi:MFS family permease